MKFETVKSFILLILVIISISLTFGLWYYQPSYDVLNEEGSMNELETDIGGKKNALSDVIKPDAMVFHNYATGQHFTFKNPMDYIQLYNNMQSWSLSEFEYQPAGELPNDEEQVEIHFPTELPIALLNHLFSINDDVELPTWSFNKAIIEFDKEASLLNVTFISTDGKNTGTAQVHNKDAYELLWGYMSTPQNKLELAPYSIPDTDKEPIFISSDSISMFEYSLSINGTDPNKLVNALFKKPSLVSTNFDESYFTDGQRDMSLLHDDKTVQFVNPYSGTYDRMDAPDLIDQTIEHINDHKGWTNDFYLSDVTISTNKVQYQMHYKGYPVFNYSNLSVIEEQWRNQNLYQYDRPIFQLKNEIRKDSKELVSGQSIMETLSNNPNYNMSKVRDLKVGYKLSYNESTQSVTLKPSWYVNYDGNWREVNDDADKMRE